MSIEVLQKVRKELGLADNDTGSVFIQITKGHHEIDYLSSQHFKFHKKDKHSMRGLQRKINALRSNVKYAKSIDPAKYEQLRSLMGWRK